MIPNIWSDACGYVVVVPRLGTSGKPLLIMQKSRAQTLVLFKPLASIWKIASVLQMLESWSRIVGEWPKSILLCQTRSRLVNTLTDRQHHR
jgi:hypothetical protein